MSDIQIEQIEQKPIIVHQGRYRLYRNPDGGLHLVYQRDESDTPDHLDLPGAMVAILDSATTGNLSPMELVKSLMTVMRNGGM